MFVGIGLLFVAFCAILVAQGSDLIAKTPS
jgi:hypothetical protein